MNIIIAYTRQQEEIHRMIDYLGPHVCAKIRKRKNQISAKTLLPLVQRQIQK